MYVQRPTSPRELKPLTIMIVVGLPFNQKLYGEGLSSMAQVAAITFGDINDDVY